MNHPDYLTEVRSDSDCADRRRKVYLTFDDGPDPIWTPKVLDILAYEQVEATFCVIGAYAAEYPQLIERIVSEGHELANHTMTHPDLSKCEPDLVRREIREANAIIKETCPPAEVKYIRAPYGTWTEDIIGESKKAGLTALHWSVDPRDWSQPGVNAIADAVMASVRPGSIVLLHDGSPPGESNSDVHTTSRGQTVDALSRLIPALKARKFVISPLPGCRSKTDRMSSQL
ncbi:chitooligosaccharide deacetylase NodB [Paraburkholderia sp. UYCP14C]|uniref:chitooligosaccharide deacetylase NodB n=1 Tax=Paraburkholderia sp. UYCP14C TaxID=2511130 RepID=UPI001020B4AA|nr:chitooligosaccharide deacetylase NodB [Paraburkholderia sp. UYCP14C]RZF23682.1 chitooligosaccharide deacetylase NodB [Paraburkholderia sp. UYCP14C]